MTTWINGRLVDDADATVSIYDHGFTVGDGVFETAKIDHGVPFALTRHLDRLHRSARGLGLDLDIAVVRKGVDAVLDTVTWDHARLRITVTGGTSPLGSARGSGGCTIVVAAGPLHGWEPTAKVCTVPWARNERAATVGLKTTSYADNVVALAYAADCGAEEAIFGNTRGELCEGTGSNVFVGIGGRLITPPLESGCLPGVTRALVIEWLGDVVEDAVPLAALESADEAFLTSSTRDIQPIASVDGSALPQAPGPLTQRALDVWARRAAEHSDP
jgi:branched-chain amino acid aminotransferase